MCKNCVMGNIAEAIQSRVTEVTSLFVDRSSFDIRKLELLVDSAKRALDDGSRIAFVGNGGSAAEAMHLAAEFTGKCVRNHRPLNVMCLNESQSSLTAIANDYGVEEMFARVAEAYLDEGDILIALTTSGRSMNILKVIEVAKQKKVKVFVWMGDHEISIDGIEVWKVPSKITPRIQEVHLAWGHIFAEILESFYEETE